MVVQGGAALDGVTDIAPGYQSFAVIRSTGTMWTWGSGHRSYAANYGPSNVLAIGWAGPASNNGPRFLTSDGVYHNGTRTVAVNCGAL